MAQKGWLFLDNKGQHHKIGLYHGDTSGHVIIYCDRRVMQLDFSVKESASYSFFVEDDLVEVSLIKSAGGFYYQFKLNEEVDTPQNRAKKAEKQKNKRILWWLLGGIGVAALLMAIAMPIYQEKLLNKRISDITKSRALQMKPDGDDLHLLAVGQKAVAKISAIDGHTFPLAKMSFQVGSRTIEHTLVQKDSLYVPSQTGFPLSDGDEFYVYYQAEDLELFQINFAEPTDNQISTYASRAAEVELLAHFDKSPAAAICLVETVLLKRTWKSLADIYGQNNKAGSNAFGHDTEAYSRLVKHPEVEAELKKQCWDK